MLYNIYICIIGGGTTDVTVIHIDEGECNVIATAGDGQCGGKHIDIILLKYILSCIVKLCGLSPQLLNTTPTFTTPTSTTIQYDEWITGLVEYICETNHTLYQQLLLISKSVKEQLSDVTEATWSITLSTFDSLLLHIISYIDTHPPHTEGQNYDPNNTNNTNNNVQVINELKIKKYINKDYFECIISRTEFESCCHTLIIQAVSVLDRCIVTCREKIHLKLNDSGIDKNDSEGALLDEVVLVGGSSRIPYIQQQILLLLQSYHITPFLPLPTTPTPTTSTTTTEIRGGNQSAEAPKSDQARKSGQGRNYGEARELCHSLDPDLAVVEGLCIQAAVMMGEDVEVLKDVLMLDVLPHSIGVFTWSSTADATVEVAAAATTEGVVETSPAAGGGGDGKNISKYNHTSNITQTHTITAHHTQYEHRIFEPVLIKGDRIPCTKYKPFQLEHKLQKFISLDIYEQHIQHHISHFSTIPKELLSTDLNTPKDNTGTTNNTNNMKDTEYTYILMGTYDLPISGQNYECDGKYYIQVEFSLDIHGALSFTVTPPPTDTATTDSSSNHTYTTSNISDNNTSSNSNNNTIHAVKLHSTFTTTSTVSTDASDATSDTMIIYLTIYIVFMLVMYISVKVYFQPPSSSTSSVVGGEL